MQLDDGATVPGHDPDFTLAGDVFHQGKALGL
jgi:hypothetical protein